MTRARDLANSADNVWTDADNTKLDGIEASATADQTASEIRTLVATATDSNVFDDASHTKLNGIEASADVTDATNVAAAGAAMLSGANFTGNVGISNTAPDFNLSVGNSSSVNPSIQIMSATNSNAQLLFGDGAGAAGYRGTVVYGNATDSMSFSTAGTERMRLDSGNLLIGGTNTFPAGNNVVGTAIRPGGDISITKAGDFAIFANRKDSDGGIIDFRKNGTSVGVIGTQNWGIGTATPSFGTTSSAGLEIAHATRGIIRLEGNNAAQALELYGDSTGGTIDARGSGAVLQFDIGGSEKMRITNGGITTVGGTSGIARLNAVAQNWPENALGIYSANISSQTNFAGIAFFNQDTDATVGNVADIYTNPTGTLSLTSASNPAIQLKYGSGGISGGTPALTVDNGGKIGIGTTVPLSALHVAGALDTSPAASGVHLGNSGSYAGMEMRGSTGAFIDFGPNDDAVDYRGRIMYTHSNNRMSFFTNGAGAAEVQMRDNGNLRLRGNDQRIEMLTNDNDYSLGSSGGAAIRFRNQGSGEEIGFEIHHAGVTHSEAMNIATKGFVTMPKQPVSQVYVSNPAHTTNGNKYEGSAGVNIGSGWDNANNRFIPPVNGTYWIHFSGFTTFTGGYGYMSIFKNGSQIYSWHFNHNNTTQHTLVSGALYLALTTSDTIDWRRGGAGNGAFSQLELNFSLFG